MLKPLRWRSRLRSAARAMWRALPVLGILTTIGLGIHYFFTIYQLQRTSDAQLRSWAAEINLNLVVGDHLDVERFRSVDLNAPNWLIQDSSGAVIDISGFLPSTVGKVRLPDVTASTTSVVLTSKFGEHWLLLRKDVVGGWVALGILDPGEYAEPDSQLANAMQRFGSTLAEAVAAPIRDIGSGIELAVIDNDGQLRKAWGGIPLQATAVGAGFLKPSTFSMQVGDKSFRLLSSPLLTSSGKSLGRVIVRRDTSVDQAALWQLLLFFDVPFVLLVLVVALAVEWVQWPRRYQPVSAAEAISQGEGEHIEFKASFQWSVYTNAEDLKLRWMVVRSVAGFLNSVGGQVLIGVDDYGSVRGLDDDLRVAHGSLDKFQQTLAHVLADQLGEATASQWHIAFETVGGHDVCVINADPAPEPVWVKQDTLERQGLTVRMANQTRTLDAKESHSYITRHWR